MPYINKEERKYFSYEGLPETAGQLNYLVTKLCNDYINLKGKHYATLNEVVGVLECAKLELYRRIAVPYEDEKIKENGDVYN